MPERPTTTSWRVWSTVDSLYGIKHTRLAGWNYPDGSTRVAAVEIQVRAVGTATTTFTVT